jgi:hypothetical protein
MVRRISLLAVVGMVMLAAQVEAQRTRPTPSPRTPGERGFIGASVGGLATSSDFDTTVDFTLYREPTSFQTSSEVPPALAFDVSGGVNLWRHLASRSPCLDTNGAATLRSPPDCHTPTSSIGCARST